MSLRDLSWDPTHIRSWHVQIPTGGLPRPSFLPTSIGFYAQMPSRPTVSEPQAMTTVGGRVTVSSITSGNHLPVEPERPITSLDTSSIHPASVCSTSIPNSNDVRCCHPASSRFAAPLPDYIYDPVPIHARPKPRSLDHFVPLTPDPPRRKLDVKTTHPASIGTRTLAYEDRSNAAITHPASSSFVPFDPATTHPASMSVQHVTVNHAQMTGPIDVRAVHPAYVSQANTLPYVPSDVRSIHPASNAFVSLDPRTTHPASVVPYNGRRPDEGNAAISHPAWVGFGYANPPPHSSRL